MIRRGILKTFDSLLNYLIHQGPMTDNNDAKALACLASVLNEVSLPSLFLRLTFKSLRLPLHSRILHDGVFNNIVDNICSHAQASNCT